MADWYRLRVRDVPLQWHEAVAIVRDVAETLAEGDIRIVPAADALAIDAEGTVHLLESASAPRQTPARDESTQVNELRRLLGDVLPPDGAPQQLVDLAFGQTAGSAPSDAAEFGRALAFFERPSRQQDLQRLAARLGEAHERHRLEKELEHLTRKARIDPPVAPSMVPKAAAKADKDRRPSERRKGYLPLLAIGVAVGVAIVAAITLFVLTGASNRLQAISAAQQTSSETSSPASDDKSGRSRPARHALVKERPPAKATSAPAVSPLAPLLPELLGSERQIEEVVVPVTSASAISPGTPRGGRARLLPGVGIRGSVTLEDAATIVYDRSDEAVMPATLVRPHLPSASQPSALGKARSVLDVLVGPDGNVEQVRLVKTTPDRRYYDAMLLPAVKAWVFQPASRGGQPVRYRIRIPII